MPSRRLVCQGHPPAGQPVAMALPVPAAQPSSGGYQFATALNRYIEDRRVRPRSAGAPAGGGEDQPRPLLREGVLDDMLQHMAAQSAATNLVAQSLTYTSDPDCVKALVPKDVAVIMDKWRNRVKTLLAAKVNQEELKLKYSRLDRDHELMSNLKSFATASWQRPQWYSATAAASDHQADQDFTSTLRNASDYTVDAAWTHMRQKMAYSVQEFIFKHQSKCLEKIAELTDPVKLEQELVDSCAKWWTDNNVHLRRDSFDRTLKHVHVFAELVIAIEGPKA